VGEGRWVMGVGCVCVLVGGGGGGGGGRDLRKGSASC
jgi:hypothetical protein